VRSRARIGRHRELLKARSVVLGRKELPGTAALVARSWIRLRSLALFMSSGSGGQSHGATDTPSSVKDDPAVAVRTSH